MTGIPYLDKTWNPITGCSGKGCAVRKTCWARAMVNRFPRLHDEATPITDFDIPIFHYNRLDQPIHWKKPRRIGVCFMGDLFDEGVPFEWIHKIWDIMKACPQHQFFILTKQAKRLNEIVTKIYQLEALGRSMGFWNHVHLGISCCTQADLDRMIPDLLQIPGKKWISLEPILEKIDLDDLDESCPGKPVEDGWCWREGISWVVIGSHSSPKQPFNLEWVESVVEQCQAAGVPVYVKQLILDGKLVRDIEKFPEHLQVREI